MLYDWRESGLLIGPIRLHKSLCLPENWSKQEGDIYTLLNFGLTFSYILKVYERNSLNNQHLYYLQREIDEYQAITVAGSSHFGYRNLISDFRTLLIILAINSFHEV